MNLEITNPLRARGIGGSKGREGGRGGGGEGKGGMSALTRNHVVAPSRHYGKPHEFETNDMIL